VVPTLEIFPFLHAVAYEMSWSPNIFVLATPVLVPTGLFVHVMVCDNVQLENNATQDVIISIFFILNCLSLEQYNKLYLNFKQNEKNSFLFLLHIFWDNLSYIFCYFVFTHLFFCKW
jgi:hypothetical protein